MAAMTVMFIPAAVFMFDEHERYPFYLARRGRCTGPRSRSACVGNDHLLVVGGVAMAALAIVVAMEAMILEAATPAAPRPLC